MHGNVALRVVAGAAVDQARARYDSIIEFAELEDFQDLKLKNYSSGMQVRLAFSVMVQVDADILLIDEAPSTGDAAFKEKCLAKIRYNHAPVPATLKVTGEDEMEDPA